jgi:hypothetical protein
METSIPDRSKTTNLMDSGHIIVRKVGSTRDSGKTVIETVSGLKLMLMETNMLESTRMVYLVDKVHILGPTEKSTRDSLSMVK